MTGSGGRLDVRRVTVMLVVALLPAASVAAYVMVFALGTSGTSTENAPPAPSATGLPFTVSVLVVASVTVPLVVTDAALMTSPSTGCVTAITGACVSSVTARVLVVAFPAASVATVVRVFEPSVNGTDPLKRPSDPTASGAPFTVTVTTVASVTDPDTVTGVWFLISPFAGAVTANTGGCVSRMTVRGWLVALLA